MAISRLDRLDDTALFAIFSAFLQTIEGLEFSLESGEGKGNGCAGGCGARAGPAGYGCGDLGDGVAALEKGESFAGHSRAGIERVAVEGAVLQRRGMAVVETE